MNDDTLLQLRQLKLRRREIEAELKRLDRRENELLAIGSGHSAATKRNSAAERWLSGQKGGPE